MISHNTHDEQNHKLTGERHGLRVESLENRNLLAADFDDAISEATPLGIVTEQPMSMTAEISNALDVDMMRVTMGSGQSVDIDVDTPQNGPGGLGGYLRVFNDQGIEIASNNDAMAPDDAALGFDPYLRFTAPQNGNYYIAVSNWQNVNFDAVSGGGDIAGQEYLTGSYQLTVKGMPTTDNDDAMNEATGLGSIGRTQFSIDGNIEADVDVDMFRVDLLNGQAVEFDIDTAQNGPGGLGSFLTLFDSNGNIVASNNDGAAPGETLGFDSYLALSVVNGGPHYLAVSNWGNTGFNPFTGNGDAGGAMYATGSYRLTMGEISPVVQPNDFGGAAPPVDSSSSMMTGWNTQSSGSTKAALNAGLSTGLNSTGILGNSMLGSSLSTDLSTNATTSPSGLTTDQLQANASAPVVDSLSSLYGTSNVGALGLNSAAQLGTTAFNFGPGQSIFGEQLDAQNAVATDMALMQTL